MTEKGEATIVIPTIVLAEAMHILEKERVSLKFKELLSTVEIGWNYTTLPLDLQIIKRANELKRLHEIHDRIITASANIINAELITKDEGIKKSGYVKTVW